MVGSDDADRLRVGERRVAKLCDVRQGAVRRRVRLRGQIGPVEPRLAGRDGTSMCIACDIISRETLTPHAPRGLRVRSSHRPSAAIVGGRARIGVSAEVRVGACGTFLIWQQCGSAHEATRPLPAVRRGAGVEFDVGRERILARYRAAPRIAHLRPGASPPGAMLSMQLLGRRGHARLDDRLAGADARETVRQSRRGEAHAVRATHMAAA